NDVVLTRLLTGTTTTVSSSANPALFGQAVTFTATVSPVGSVPVLPGGIVTFLDGPTTLGTGTLSSSAVATFTTPAALPLGSHAITAAYAGTGDFTPSNGSLTQTINPVPTPAVPVLANLSTATALEGSAAIALTVTGTNFVSGAAVLWSSSPLPTAFV